MEGRGGLLKGMCLFKMLADTRRGTYLKGDSTVLIRGEALIKGFTIYSDFVINRVFCFSN